LLELIKTENSFQASFLLMQPI